MIESQPEIVAHHFTEAGLASEAIGYWVKAGRQAHARWANREAAGFFEQALRVLATLPETRETLEQAIDLRFDLKTSLIPLGQFERIIGYLREAESLANVSTINTGWRGSLPHVPDPRDGGDPWKLWFWPAGADAGGFTWRCFTPGGGDFVSRDGLLLDA